MNTLTLLVFILLGMVFLLVSTVITYLAYRHPAVREPLMVGLAALAVLGSLLTPIVTR
ncbi:hypothetical protein DER30_4641 [Streptomyces sp. HB202]|nr:hypothetical protein [Streptomyces sp. HB202]RDL03089.1 hypothetical protein DER30_4641 [Streptomyces sp. HB202]